MTRICITGGPRTGKTTLGLRLTSQQGGHAASCAPLVGNDGLWCSCPGRMRCTDDLIHLGWSEASQAAALWLDAPGPWIVEGVAVSRALRKWKDAHPGEPPPVDRVIYLSEPHEQLSPGQIAMMKGVHTVHTRDVEPWLRSHGITTEHQ